MYFMCRVNVMNKLPQMLGARYPCNSITFEINIIIKFLIRVRVKLVKFDNRIFWVETSNSSMKLILPYV